MLLGYVVKLERHTQFTHLKQARIGQKNNETLLSFIAKILTCIEQNETFSSWLVV